MSKPRKQFKGHNYQEMNAVLNQHLLSSGKAMRPCDDFTLSELHSVRTALFAAREPALAAVYEPKNDGRMMTVKSAQELVQQNDHRQQIAEQDPSLVPMLRDGLCHETVMWFVHHLTEVARKKFSKVIPALPVSENLQTESVSSFNLTCQSCHVDNSEVIDKPWPVWPEEWKYEALGYGAFPFTLPVSGFEGSYHRTGWYSRKQMAQRIHHQNCDLSKSGGPGHDKAVDCDVLFTGGDIYVYTDQHCCRNVQNAETHNMLTERQDWQGVEDPAPVKIDYEGTYHQGAAMLYQHTDYSTRWYVTTVKGLPVEKGESPMNDNIMGNDHKHRCDVGSRENPPSDTCFWQEYDFNNFKVGPIDAHIFTLPEHCKPLKDLPQF
jgi:hypothetical protein